MNSIRSGHVQCLSCCRLRKHRTPTAHSSSMHHEFSRRPALVLPFPDTPAQTPIASSRSEVRAGRVTAAAVPGVVPGEEVAAVARARSDRVRLDVGYLRHPAHHAPTTHERLRPGVPERLSGEVAPRGRGGRALGPAGSVQIARNTRTLPSESIVLRVFCRRAGGLASEKERRFERPSRAILVATVTNPPPGKPGPARPVSGWNAQGQTPAVKGRAAP